MRQHKGKRQSDKRYDRKPFKATPEKLLSAEKKERQTLIDKKEVFASAFYRETDKSEA